MIKLTVYLLFNGACKQAMEFYQSCFRGKLNIQKAGESVMKGQMPSSMHQKVLNARLKGKNVDIQLRTGCDPTENQYKVIWCFFT